MILDVDVNTESPLGRAFMKIIAVLKELEREEISRRTMEATQYLKRIGKPLNGYAPIGYRVVGRKKKSRYVTDEPARRWAYEIVRLHEEQGMSFRSISRHIKFMRTSQGNVPNKFWHHRLVGAAYVAAKCGFPLIPQKEMPYPMEIKRYMAAHGGRPPLLVPGATRGGPLRTSKPMTDPRQVYAPHIHHAHQEPCEPSSEEPESLDV